MKYVIDGGPRSGKSTVLSLARAHGFQVIDEAAIQIKEEQSLLEHPVLPHTHPGAFQVLVDARQRFNERAYTNADSVVLCDRSLITQIGYCKAYGIPIPPEVEISARQAQYEGVFLLETLPDAHYVMDDLHPEQRSESLRIGACVKQAYIDHGYAPRDIGFAKPVRRLSLILSDIAMRL